MTKYCAHPALLTAPHIGWSTLARNSLAGSANHAREISAAIEQANAAWQFVQDKSKVSPLSETQTNHFLWNLRSFFWELYSATEFALQWCNQEYNLGFPLNQVRWASMKEKRHKKVKPGWIVVRARVDAFMRSEMFYEISQYRHAQHRSILLAQIAISDTHGIRSVNITPARVGQTFSGLTPQLEAYVSFTREFLADLLPTDAV